MANKSSNFIANVFNRQRQLKLNKANLEALVCYAMQFLKCQAGSSINLMFVRDKVIREYHRDYLGKDSATDVITFQAETEDIKVEEGLSLGDLIISVDHAIDYAQENNIEVGEELARYVVHGLLHCLGHQDYSPEDQTAMFAVQEEILTGWLEKNNPNICEHKNVLQDA